MSSPGVLVDRRGQKRWDMGLCSGQARTQRLRSNSSLPEDVVVRRVVDFFAMS